MKKHLCIAGLLCLLLIGFGAHGQCPTINGLASVCLGNTTSLSNTLPGGVWSSSNSGVATINATTGLVTSAAAGTTVITYTGSCGSVTTTVTVQTSAPGPIGGPDPLNACSNFFIQFTNSVPGGVWSSSNTALPAIMQNGVLSTSSAAPTGSTVISYYTGCGAVATRTITTTKRPPQGIYGAGISPLLSGLYLCPGASLTLSNDGSPLGTWTSTNTSVVAINVTTGAMTALTTGTVIVYANQVCLGRGINVYIQSPTNIISGSGVFTMCSGSTITLSNATTPGTWSSGNTAVATIDGNGVVYPLAGASGTVPITYMLYGGCSSSATITVIASPGPISGAAGVCVPGTITLSNVASGGTWSTGATGTATISGGGVVTGVSPGIAVFTYTTACGAATHTVTVTSGTSPITGNTQLCGALTTTLSNATQPGTWSSGNTSLATIEPTTGIAHVVLGGGTGTVPITYTTTGGCTAQTTLTITVSMSVIAGAGTICAGATVMLSNASPNGTWTSSNSSVATVDINTGMATGVSMGTTLITYTSDCGFTTASLTVGALPAITGSSTVCAGATINLSIASSGGTWSSSATGIATVSAGGAVRGVSSGTVLITYNAGTGCISTKTITVNPMPAPISAPAILCVGSAGALSDPIPGGTWSSSNTVVSIAGNTVAGNTAGISLVTYMLPGGCFETATITVSPPPGAITGNLAVCAGATTTLSNAVPGGTWTSASTSVAIISAGGVVTGIAQGSAIVTYATGSGCIATATITVQPQPGPITGMLSICAGGTSQLSNSVAGGVWGSGTTSVATVSNGALVSAVMPGTSLIVYSIGSCVAFTTATVVAQPPAIIGVMQVCVGAARFLSNAVGGGVWTSAASSVATIDAATGTVTGVAVGTMEISYTLGGGCMVTATITVLPAPFAGVISGPGSVCAGSQIMLSNTVSGGAWSSAVSSVATVDAAGVVGGVNAGMATISYTVFTSCGNVSATAAIAVVALPVAGAISGPDELCVGSTIALSDNEPGGVWSCAAGVATVSNTGVVTGLNAGVVTISYTVTNACGAAVATATITVHPLPDAGIIIAPDSLCAGGSTVLSSSVGGGVWGSSNSAAATIDNATGTLHAVALGATTIRYTVTAIGGCSSVATYTFAVVPPSFGLGVTIKQVSCFGAKDGSIETFITGVKPTFDYLWSTGATGQGITGLDTGYYTLHVAMMQTQCALDTAFTIVQPAALTLSGQVSDDLCGNATGGIDVAVAGGTSPYSYKWSNNATANAVTGLHAGTYSVIVTDVNNCHEDYAAVVADSCSAIVIHDVITPNGDGYNDVWVIEGIQGYPASTIQVFDKWGDRVLDKRGYQNDWNGSGKNGSLPDGTYYYLIKLNGANATGGADTFTGYVMIKR